MLVTLLVPSISCWKPIPSHPTAFSISQSYPSFGNEASITRKSSNELLSSDTSDFYVDSFHKDNFAQSHEDVSAFRHVNDGRNSKSFQFENNIFNGIYHDVSKAF